MIGPTTINNRKRFDVQFTSKPGPYAQYDFVITVEAIDAVDAQTLAYRRVKRDFPDRSWPMWAVEVRP